VLKQGYAHLEREWKSGDEVKLELSMPVERLHAHPAVRADAGQVALQRGPVVYCLEGADADVPLHEMVLPETARLQAHFEPGLLGGVSVVTAEAQAEDAGSWGESLYKAEAPKLRPVPLKAVPYSTWANREPGEMRVWIRTQ
jgi:DUF1680 family protein